MYFLRKTSAGHAHCKSREPPHRQIATLGWCKVLHASGLLGGARRFAVRDQDHGAERPPIVPRLEPLGCRVVIAELAGTHERSFCAGAGDVPSSSSAPLSGSAGSPMDFGSPIAGARTRFSNRWRED